MDSFVHPLIADREHSQEPLPRPTSGGKRDVQKPFFNPPLLNKINNAATPEVTSFSNIPSQKNKSLEKSDGKRPRQPNPKKSKGAIYIAARCG